MTKTISINGHNITIKGLVSAWDAAPATIVSRRLRDYIDGLNGEHEHVKAIAENTVYPEWFGEFIAATVDAPDELPLPSASAPAEALYSAFETLFQTVSRQDAITWITAISELSRNPNDPDLLPPSDVDPNA